MTTKSHYYFGAYLLSSGLNGINKLEKASFLYGCMEPDFNPGTYLKGSVHVQKLRGHNFQNMLPCIEKLFEKIEHHKPFGILYFYRLGKLTHYLIDAFTYPHNSIFCGSIKDHILYEAKLQELFICSLKKCQMPLDNQSYENPYMMFLKTHKEYLSMEMGEERDIYFAQCVIPNIVYSVYAQSFYLSKLEVLYENFTNI